MKRVEDHIVSRFFAGLCKQEKITLVVFAFAAFGTVYLSWELFLAPGIVSEGVRDVVVMLFAVSIFGIAAIQNYSNGPLEDERDRQIKAKGNEAGYFALILLLIVTGGIVRTNGFPGYLGSDTQTGQEVFEVFLLLCIAISVVVNFAVRAYDYWRDRRAVAE